MCHIVSSVYIVHNLYFDAINICTINVQLLCLYVKYSRAIFIITTWAQKEETDSMRPVCPHNDKAIQIGINVYISPIFIRSNWRVPISYNSKAELLSPSLEGGHLIIYFKDYLKGVLAYPTHSTSAKKVNQGYGNIHPKAC